MRHHHHHNQMRSPHHLSAGSAPAATPAAPPTTPYVIVAPTPAPPPAVIKRPSSGAGESLNALAMVGVLFIFLFLVYFVAMTVSSSSHLLYHAHGDGNEDGMMPRMVRGGGRGNKGYDEQMDEGKCIHQLEQEKRIKASLIEQVKQLESDLTEERRKYRELEQDYRDLALSARAQQAQKPVQVQQGGEGTDVSAMQRLAKCRSAVEESTQTIKDLREHNKNLDGQVTRLQKELREAISDADEQERIAADCEKKLRSSASSSTSAKSAHAVVPPPKPPPPPLPDDEDDD